jgi:hypothetical protein
MTTRECPACTKSYPILPNSLWRGIKKGIRIICKACYYEEYRINNREQINNNQTAWSANNPDKVKNAQAKYVNSGKALKKRKENPLYSVRAVARANKAKHLNPKKYRDYQRMYQSGRRLTLRNIFNKYHALETLVFYENCPENLTVDHIIPVKNKDVCGLHVSWNLQYLTQSLNSKKSNSFDGTYDNNSWVLEHE